MRLFDSDSVNPAIGRPYDVSPDARRFLMLKHANDPRASNAAGELKVVLNWSVGAEEARAELGCPGANLGNASTRVLKFLRSGFLLLVVIGSVPCGCPRPVAAQGAQDEAQIIALMSGRVRR